MPKLYKQVEKFVEKSFDGNTKHLKRTVYWIKKLKPDADDALLIACISHDIERAFRKNDVHQKIKHLGFMNEEFLSLHQETGANIIGDFLKKNKADANLIKRVKILVSKHEVGGNDDQNILKDADSLSFFENNIEHFLKDQTKKYGNDKVREKIKWMYNRITSKRAKKFAKKWYENAVKELDRN